MESIIKSGNKELFIELDQEDYIIESIQKTFRVETELKL